MHFSTRPVCAFTFLLLLLNPGVHLVSISFFFCLFVFVQGAVGGSLALVESYDVILWL